MNEEQQTEIKTRGVKTEKGKSISKWNALKHGVLRESVSEYEKLDYQTLYTELVEEFDPSSEVYSRYQTTAENMIYKGIIMLKALKNKVKYK